MSRRTRGSRIQAQKTASGALKPGVKELDPATEKEVNALFLGFLKRLGVTLLIMAGAAITVVIYGHARREVGALIVFLAIVCGLAFSYGRGVDRVFAKLKRLGLERARRGRYADAAFILEQFHRVGNMGYDRDGEVHYHLALAYLALDKEEKAREIAQWLRRHRSKHPYADRAVQAVESKS